MKNPSPLAYRSTYESIVQKVEDSDVANTIVDAHEKDSIEKRGVHLEDISQQLLSSESDAILFHLGFAAIAILAISISPKSSLGVVVIALVVSWYIGIFTVAILRNHKEWLDPLRFLFILCIYFIFPDGFLAKGLKTIHFPDYGVGKIYEVSIVFTMVVAAAARENKRCIPTKALEVELGIDHRDSFHSPVFMDIYACDTKTSRRYKLKKHKKTKVPLIIMICGGILRKEVYETFARGMVEKGYIIAVLDHPVQFGLSINNFATPVDISNALSYFEDKMLTNQEVDEEYSIFSAVDLNKVVLLGHSFGFSTVLNAINEQCTPPFCQFGTKVPFHQGVILTAGFGGSLVMFQSISGESTSYFHDNLNNLDVPAGLFYGDKDKTVMFEFGREKENGLVGTFSRMMPTTVSVVIKGLDHFSIVEEFPEWHPDMNSTVSMVSSLPRSDQLVTVAHVLDKWIKDNISRKKATDKFCEALSRESKRLGHKFPVKGVEVERCLEKYDGTAKGAKSGKGTSTNGGWN